MVAFLKILITKVFQLYIGNVIIAKISWEKEKTTGIIIHNDKVLVHRIVNSDHYVLVAGRVEILRLL